MLIFNELKHTYRHDTKNVLYKGATTFLKCVEKPYNTDYWTSYKAVEYFLLTKEENVKQWWLLKQILKEEFKKGKTNDEAEHLRTVAITNFIKNSQSKYKFLTKKESIRVQWETKKNNACAKGTKKHKIKENLRIDELNGIASIDDALDALLDAPTIFQHPSTPQGDKLSIDLCTLKSNVWYPEVIVYNDELELCGTIDDLMLEPSGNKIKIHINDWKTNESIDVNNNYGNYLLPPVEHLMECNYNKYRLQLSLYYVLIAMTLGEDKCIPGIVSITHIDNFDKETVFAFPPLVKEIKNIIKMHNAR